MRYCIHHLNDFSGSPLILRERMNAMLAHGPVTLITNRDVGFLSTWPGTKIEFSYFKHQDPVRRFISLSYWYIQVGIYLLQHAEPGDSITLSTLISSPLILIRSIKAGLYIEIFVNEVFFRVPIWRWIGLTAINSSCVNKIYLSRFVQDKWSFAGPSAVVYPSLRQSIIDLATEQQSPRPADPSGLRFLLVCSQIDAKGYRLFIEIARHFEKIGGTHSFTLYLSGSEDRFISDYPSTNLPNNLSVFFNNTSAEIFFGHDVFLGLTDPAAWIETFGQTFAEAMVAGNITIVPPVGAQLEYLRDGDNGLVFSEYTLRGLLAQVDRIMALPDLNQMKARARSSMLAFLKAQKHYRPTNV